MSKFVSQHTMHVVRIARSQYYVLPISLEVRFTTLPHEKSTTQNFSYPSQVKCLYSTESTDIHLFIPCMDIQFLDLCLRLQYEVRKVSKPIKYSGLALDNYILLSMNRCIIFLMSYISTNKFINVYE